MKPSSKLCCLWWQLKMNPFVSATLAGWLLFAPLYFFLGESIFLAILVLWGMQWAVLEHVAPNWRPCHLSRLLTPNFFAVRDLTGGWRIFQRSPGETGDCQVLLKGLLKDQIRLPEALLPGRYRALTHETILGRLRRLPHVEIQSCRRAYVATMEATVSRAVKGRCRHCTDGCPFLGRSHPRQFYDVRFLVKKKAAPKAAGFDKGWMLS